MIRLLISALDEEGLKSQKRIRVIKEKEYMIVPAIENYRGFVFDGRSSFGQEG